VQADRGTSLIENQARAVPPSSPPDGGTDVAPRRRRIVPLLCIAAVVLAADLATKLAAVAELEHREPVRLFGGALYLVHARNTGAAFSLGEGYTIVLSLFAVGVAVYILRAARRLRSLGWTVGLGLVLGGAVGNLIDRVFRAPGFLRGGVVDFLSLFDDGGRVWPIFNVADACLVTGVCLLVLLVFRGIQPDGTQAGAAAERKADDDQQR
jgi:signal peptidase II